MAENDIPMTARRLVRVPARAPMTASVEIPARSGAVTADVYMPARVTAPPVVVVGAGYRDAGFRAMFGCSFREMASVRDWCGLIAEQGIAALAYSNHDPAADFDDVLEAIGSSGTTWGVDSTRVGVLATSGNVPVALSALMKGGSPAVRCAAFLYGFMLDGDAVTATATASAQFGFATPCASRGIDDVRDDAAVLIVRAGQDQFAGLNDTIDRFATGALRRNLPATLMNLPASPHAFDLFADDGASHVAIDAVLAFLRSHLGT